MPTYPSDGDYLSPATTGGDVRHLPFLNRGDETNYIIERFVEQDLAEFATPALGQEATATHGGPSAAGDTLYLIDESPLDPAAAQKGMAVVSRLWAPEMSAHIRYGYTTVNIPDFRGLSYDPGTGAITPTFEEATRSVQIGLGTDLTLTSSTRFFTAGTFTVSTSASIAYNASAASMKSTIEAAIVGGLGSVFSSVSVGVEATHIRITFYHSASYSGDMTDSFFDLSGLTPVGRVEFEYYSTSTIARIYPETATFNTTGAHGLTTDNRGYIRNGTGFSEPVVVTVLDTDTFTVPNSYAMSQESVLDTYALSGFCYIRSKPVPCRWIYQHYMPGVTPGISNVSDIPPLTVSDYDFALYKAIVDQQDTVYISVSDIEQPYPNLYVRVAIQIDVASLFD